MNQKQPPATGGIKGRRQGRRTGLPRKAAAFILNLPNQPVGCQDPPNTELLGWILSIAMADCIHQGLVQPQLNALSREDTTNRLSEQLQQRGKLQCGRQGELSPAKPLAKPLGRHSWAR